MLKCINNKIMVVSNCFCTVKSHKKEFLSNIYLPALKELNFLFIQQNCLMLLIPIKTYFLDSVCNLNESDKT